MCKQLQCNTAIERGVEKNEANEKTNVCLLLRWQGVKKWCVLFLRQEGKMDSITEWGSVLIPYN